MSVIDCSRQKGTREATGVSNYRAYYGIVIRLQHDILNWGITIVG